MDFLTTALFSVSDGNSEELSGALLTKFFPDDITSRARVVFADVDQLHSGVGIEPCGFGFTANKTLMSDTQARRELDDSLTRYVGSEVSGRTVSPNKDLIDVVLHGAFYGAHIVQNFSDVEKGVPGVEPILIPMLNFKVSNSSFNIYAAYKNSEGFYKTMSLIDIETDLSYSFVMVIDEADAMHLEPIMSVLEPLEDMAVFAGQKLFRVNAPFEPFYTFTGEAFCNYLAYNVAYYNIGMKVIKEFLEDTKYIDEAVGEPEKAYVGKKPKHNVSIVCEYNRTYTRQILSCINDQEKCTALLKNNEEAYITYVWLQKIFKASQSYPAEESSIRISAACASILHDCKLQLLHFACELLAQRYYICKLGIFNDTLNVVLGGGGVNGRSIKKITG